MILSLERDRQNTSVIKHYLGMSMNQMRYLDVGKVIDKFAIKSLIDFGCSEGLLIQKLARADNIELLVGVDIDQSALSYTVLNTFPENIQQSIQYSRQTDENIYVYKGDVTKKYRKLKQIQPQLITLVELIEHLVTEDVQKAVENIFGYLRPNYCYISTPNRQFNIHFHSQENQHFRHWDHKFEWTREEFLNFCESVKNQYGYGFQIGGIGQHTSDDSKGCCTQYAIFTRQQSNSNSINEFIIEQDEQLQERAHYENKSWKNNLNKIMQYVLFKSLYYKEHISFEAAIEFIAKEPIGQCLSQIGEVVNKEFIMKYLEMSPNDFLWDTQNYQVKRLYQSSSSQDLNELNEKPKQSIVTKPCVGEQAISQREYSVSYSHSNGNGFNWGSSFQQD